MSLPVMVQNRRGWSDLESRIFEGRYAALNRFRIASLIDRITRIHPEPMICQMAAEHGLVSRPGAADEYVWNGYPVSFRLIRGPEDSAPVSAEVEICTGTAGKLRILKWSRLSRLLRRWLRKDVGRLESGLEIISEPDELRVRRVPVEVREAPPQ